MVLLVSVLGSFVLAYALSLTIGGIYVPFVMPLVVGFLLGAIGGFIARRFELIPRRPVILAALLGAAIAYLGYHMLAYLRTMDVLAAQWGLGAADAALAAIESEGFGSGFFGYLSFVSVGTATHYHPLGLLGRGEPSLTANVIVMVVELGLTMVSATFALLWRTRAAAAPKFYVPIDDAAFQTFRTALQRLDWAGAGAALATSRGEPRHAVTLEEASGATRIEAFALDVHGVMREREEQRMVGEAQAKLLSDGYLAALTPGGRP